MKEKGKRRKKITRSMVLNMRGQGKSYPQIAHDLGISVSGAYYAANPRKRAGRNPTLPMRTNSLYMERRVWDELYMTATDKGLSMSVLAQRILLGEAPALVFEPTLPVDD